MKKIIICIVLVLLVAGVVGLVAGSYWMFTPLQTTAEVGTFVIAKGDTFTKVGEKLAKEGYIRHPLVFRFIGKRNGNPVIHPGTFEITKAMSPQEIYDALSSEPVDAWVTLLEGWRSEEMAEELFLRLGDNFSKDEFIALAKSKEGMLFPDTYLFPKDATAAYVISVLENTFEKRFATAKKDVVTLQVTDQEIPILASLVQREAKTATDMNIVAGILVNRLNVGMPLQVDATLQYARGYDQTQQSWWAEPKAADKEIMSPYNTYKNPGLPPAAICNPGLLALEAAAEPAASKYFYYISDRQGNMYYAVTYDEHLANIQKYLR